MNESMRDVVIVGGGAAGLSAALTLARARRTVTVVDAGEPRNAPAAGAHGLLGLEGINPLELLARGRGEVASYGGAILEGRVDAVTADADGFSVSVSGQRGLKARVVLIASGVVDELPDIPGIRERWGRDVVHCPYCHGWEVRDQNIGLLAGGTMSPTHALLFRQWSSNLRYLRHGSAVSNDDATRLGDAGIPLVDGEVARLDIVDDRLRGVRLRDGGLVELDALVVKARTHARLDGLDGLALETTEDHSGLTLVADAVGHTSVPGVWAAGNVVNQAMQVSEAAANGARVAMMINTEMMFPDFAQVVASSQKGEAA